MNGVNGFRKRPVPGASAPSQTAPTISTSPPSVNGSENPSLTSKALMNGYNGVVKGQHDERARHNPLGKPHTQNTAHLNANDPVAMHLLVETALGDSSEYEVLSYEEVEDLKKEQKALIGYIDGLKRRFARENKVRDAASSMSRLYSKKGRGSVDGSRESAHMSLFGRLSGNHENFRQMDEELAASNRRCEEVAQELWRKERRATEIQRRLLHHTAGVLQMTHRSMAKRGRDAQGLPMQLPPPGSPESMDMYTTWRESNPTVGDDFDDRSQYRDFGRHDRSVANSEGRSKSGSPGRPSSRRSVSGQQAQVIAFTERKLEDLNQRLQDVLVQMNPTQQVDLPPPQAQANGVPLQVGMSMQTQLEYLEKSLGTMERNQGGIARSAQETEYAMEDRVGALNTKLHQILLAANNEEIQHRKAPPQLSGRSLQSQLDYLDDELETVEQHLESSSGRRGSQEKTEQYETVLTGLWEIIKSGEEEVRQRKKQLRQQRGQAVFDEKDDDAVPDEAFSIQAFSAKVQSLYARSTALEEQKDILQRQVQQQRELNNKSDSAKDAEVARATEELNKTKAALTTAKQEAGQAKGELDDLVHVVGQRQEEILKLQSALDETRHLHESAKTEQQGVSSELRQQLQAKDAELAKLHGETEGLESEVVRLQTEVTVAKAELDGAYGTRAQRAAENPQKVDELSQRVETLQRELADTIDEYEAMTKQSIEFEKEREQLERTVDELRDRCEGVETQLNDEKVRWMGIKSPGGPNGGKDGAPPVESTSTSTLRSEFRKMMRDTKAENTKILRAEQEERRRLEALVRTLKKEHHTAGKSSLSQSTSAASPR
ncbi:MAG: hypothetical protein M1825_003967 [Sarcosagium campestre]|nr:MAG: hypothetical protein M1825_003967 [Sarcosagium campestre]